MKTIIYLVIIWIFNIRNINGSSNFNATTVSLLDVEDCDIPLIEPQVQKINIQLLQLSKFELINVNAKFLFQELYYCGMHSYVSTVNNARAEYIIDTTFD